jgi:hypothetical protein
MIGYQRTAPVDAAQEGQDRNTVCQLPAHEHADPVGIYDPAGQHQQHERNQAGKTECERKALIQEMGIHRKSNAPAQWRASVLARSWSGRQCNGIAHKKHAIYAIWHAGLTRRGLPVTLVI